MWVRKDLFSYVWNNRYFMLFAKKSVSCWYEYRLQTYFWSSLVINISSKYRFFISFKSFFQPEWFTLCWTWSDIFKLKRWNSCIFHETISYLGFFKFPFIQSDLKYIELFLKRLCFYRGRQSTTKDKYVNVIALLYVI